MNNKEIIIQAIKNKNLMNFIYDKNPIRKTAPHALYVSSTGKENMDAFQYEGFSKTGNLPAWRNFTISKIENLEVLDEQFKVADGYKSNSPRYNNCIHKI